MSAFNLPSKLILILLWLIVGCNKSNVDRKDILEQNLKQAGKNRIEIEKVLNHYSKDSKDSLRYKAAVFLISNMEDNHHFGGSWLKKFDSLYFDQLRTRNNPGLKLWRDSVEGMIGLQKEQDVPLLNDLQHLTSDYLINNINQAFKSWQEAPWAASVSFDAFCNYILPYHLRNEHREEWRTLLQKRYSFILNNPDIPKTMEDISCAMVDEQSSWFKWTERLDYRPATLSLSQILRSTKGSCNEMSLMGVYAARAHGIPTTVDYVPQYGNYNDVHKWNALMLSDSTFISFEGCESRPGDMFYPREKDNKFAKVYRMRYSLVPGSFAMKARVLGIRDMPSSLDDPRIMDVTSSYAPVANIILSVRGKENKPVYLCINKWKAWTAIDGGFIKQDTVRFSNMGRGLVYLPAYYSDGELIPAGPPFLLTLNGEIKTMKVEKDQLRDMDVFRRFSFKRNWVYTIANGMIDGRFEASNDSSFSDPVVLYKIPPKMEKYNPKLLNDLAMKDRFSYDSSWTKISVKDKTAYRYVRLFFQRPRIFRVGEIEFYESNNAKPIKGIPFGNVAEPNYAFDGFPGMVIKLPTDTLEAHWVGMDFGKPTSLDHIRYIPATDAAAVQNDKHYELFYWDKDWVSAGQQIADSYKVQFKNVPAGTLYLLHCRDCEYREERIFTYEDGKQLFW